MRSHEKENRWDDHLLCFPFYRFTELELYSFTQYIFEPCPSKNSNIEKGKKKKIGMKNVETIVHSWY